jgi:hypothetical protein
MTVVAWRAVDDSSNAAAIFVIGVCMDDAENARGRVAPPPRALV